MSEKENDFWQDHSLEFLEMAFGQDNRERIANPDGYGKNVGDCGDTVEIFLLVEGEMIQHAAFDVDGCLNTAACANTVVQMVLGRPLAEAWDISPEQVIAYLQTLPAGSAHCAELAVGALYLAVSDFEKRIQVRN
ncbi:MAG: iron-sulfur cluster assembly scaffold protein [bacterium]